MTASIREMTTIGREKRPASGTRRLTRGSIIGPANVSAEGRPPRQSPIAPKRVRLSGASAPFLRIAAVRRGALPIPGCIGRLPGIAHFAEVTPGIRPRTVEVGEAIDLCHLDARQGLSIPARTIGIGGKRRNRATDEARRFG